MPAIILEEGIELVSWQCRIVKVIKRVFVPYNVNILKQKIESKHRNKLYTNDFRHHHGCKSSVTVALGCLGGYSAEILMIQTKKRKAMRM